MTARQYRNLRRDELSRRASRLRLGEGPVIGILQRRIVTGSSNVIPAGARIEITDKWNGVTIRTVPCAACGCQVGCREVPYEDVEIEVA
jgi:hypothetical protein